MWPGNSSRRGQRSGPTVAPGPAAVNSRRGYNAGQSSSGLPPGRSSLSPIGSPEGDVMRIIVLLLLCAAIPPSAGLRSVPAFGGASVERVVVIDREGPFHLQRSPHPLPGARRQPRRAHVARPEPPVRGARSRRRRRRGARDRPLRALAAATRRARNDHRFRRPLRPFRGGAAGRQFLPAAAKASVYNVVA